MRQTQNTLMKKKKIFKKSIKVFIFSALIFVATFNTVHANIMADIALTTLTKIASFINTVLGFIGGTAMYLAAGLVNWSLDLNNYILQSNVVQTGWRITRDLANLGFVLAIILIALATILRIESYGMKKTLGKLIIAALTINFSLVIAGVFIDFGGTLTSFFINKATNNNPAQLASALANSLQIQKLLIPPEDASTLEKITGALGNNFNGGLIILASGFFVTILTFSAALALLGVAAMFFLRYLYLNFLLVLMPLAWLAWIWPDLSGYAKDWFQNFFKWIIFGPMAAFSIYLALSIAFKGGLSSSALGGTQVMEGFWNSAGLTIKNLGGILAQMISVISILVGGMMMANKTAGGGADWAIKGITKARGMILGAPLAGAGWLAKRARTWGAGEKGEKPSWMQGAATRLSGIPIPGAKYLGGQLSKFASGTKEDAEKYRKDNLSHLTNEQILARAKNPLTKLNPVEVAAMANELAKRNLTDKLDDEKLTQYLIGAKKMGLDKEMLKTRPDLAIKISLNIDETLAGIKVKEADDISAKALENASVVSSPNFTINHIERILKNGSAEQKAAIAKGLENVSEDKRSQISEKLEFINQNISSQPFVKKKPKLFGPTGEPL